MNTYLSGWEGTDKYEVQDLCNFVTYSSPGSPIISPLKLPKKPEKHEFYIPVRKKLIKIARKKSVKDYSIIKLNSTFINLESKINLQEKLIQKFGKVKENNLLKKQKNSTPQERNKLKKSLRSDSKFTVIDLIEKVKLCDNIKRINDNRKKFFTISKIASKHRSKQKQKPSSLDLIDILTKTHLSQNRQLSPTLHQFSENKLQFPNVVCKSYKSSSEHKKAYTDIRYLR